MWSPQGGAYERESCARFRDPDEKSGLGMQTTAKRERGFPWRKGNRFRALIDAEQFYPAMLEGIAGARVYVALEMYLVESGRVAGQFIDALCAAAGRGVLVCLLLDDYGAWGLSKSDRQRLLDSGVRIAYYNPVRFGKWLRNLFRDHRKLLLVDGEQVFLGGAGITDVFDPPRHPERRWRETMLAAQGPCVGDWQQLFEQNWNAWSLQQVALPASRAQRVNTGQRGRVVATGTSGRQHITQSLVKRLRRCRHRAWIATAYFVPSWKIRRALRRAAHAGVDVRLLVPGPHSDHPAVSHAGRRFYYRLLRHGVRIFEYQPRFTHSKMALCDKWVTVGSSNIDRWNLSWNLEANQEVDDQGFADEIAAVFERDFAHSVEHSFEQWRRRPRYRRFQEWFWGKVDVWLAHFARGRRVWPTRRRDDR